MNFTLTPSAPYDFHKTVERLRSHNEMIVIEPGPTIVRTLRPGLEADPLLIRATFAGTVDEPRIKIDVANPTSSGIAKRKKAHVGTNADKLADQFKRMFTMDMDIAAFYGKMEEDPVMRRVVRELYGLRLITDADLFESMLRTIIGQQVTVSFASTLTKRLASLTCEPMVIDGTAYAVFPTPSQVASLTVAQLRELQFSTRKAEYVIDFAKHVCSGTVDLDALYGMENEEILERLTALRGIGRWTVECLLLFGMGREDLLPAADIGLRNAVRNQYGLERQATEAEVRDIGEKWAPFRSYATYYLWETL